MSAKKRLGSRTGELISRIFDVRSWADWERSRSSIIFLRDMLKKLFILQNKKTKETFEAAVIRLKLTDEDLEIKKKSLLRLARLMLVVAIFLLMYVIYQLCYGGILGFAISVVVMLIAIVLAFRYHFWYFQIKQRKLGTTIREWFRIGILGEKQ